MAALGNRTRRRTGAIVRTWLRLVAGHEAALNELMERHAGKLFNYLIRCLQNEEDAADTAAGSFFAFPGFTGHAQSEWKARSMECVSGFIRIGHCCQIASAS